MIPEELVALSKAVCRHYTGKEDTWIEYVSTCASFIKQLNGLGYSISPTPPEKEVSNESAT